MNDSLHISFHMFWNFKIFCSGLFQLGVFLNFFEFQIWISHFWLGKKCPSIKLILYGCLHYFNHLLSNYSKLCSGLYPVDVVFEFFEFQIWILNFSLEEKLSKSKTNFKKFPKCLQIIVCKLENFCSGLFFLRFFK